MGREVGEVGEGRGGDGTGGGTGRDGTGGEGRGGEGRGGEGRDDGYTYCNRPLSRRLDRCDRVIQNESRDPFGANVSTSQCKLRSLRANSGSGVRNLHCDVVHITTKWVSSLTLDCNGVSAIKAYRYVQKQSNDTTIFK